MPTYKHAHGTTFHQTIVLGIIAREGPITSGEIAERYAELTKIGVAYNYQYIITRRMADRGLIKAQTKTRTPGRKKGESSILKWVIAPAGKKLLQNTRPLVELLREFT